MKLAAAVLDEFADDALIEVYDGARSVPLVREQLGSERPKICSGHIVASAVSRRLDHGSLGVQSDEPDCAAVDGLKLSPLLCCDVVGIRCDGNEIAGAHGGFSAGWLIEIWSEHRIAPRAQLVFVGRVVDFFVDIRPVLY
jgi:hypothetical protein